AVVAGLAAALVSAPSIRNGFVEDDHWVIEQRALLRHPPSLPAVLTAPYWPPSFGGTMWRPAVLTTYALDYRVSANPWWFHFVNVVWAAVAAALLALLASLVTDAGVGLAVGLLFAVHPVHVEAVANVVGRAELMAAAGYAFALIAALRAEQNRWWLAGVVLGGAFAMVSKEHPATLPAAVLLLVLIRGLSRGEHWRGSLRSAWPLVAGAALPVLVYFAVRPLVVQGKTFESGGLAPGLGGLGLLARAWGMAPLSLVWLRLLIVPAHLSVDYSPTYAAISTGLTLPHLAAIGTWAALAWGAWRLRRRTWWPLLGLLWFAITIAPVSNILVPTEILVAERTLYLPSWGAMLALVATIAALTPPRVRGPLLAIAVVFGGWRTVTRIAVWRNDSSFTTALERDAPTSYRSLWQEGQDAFDAGRWGSGEKLLREAITAAPQIPGPKEELARRYAAAGHWQPAVVLLQGAIADDSSRTRPWIELPRVLLAAGDTAGAAAVAQTAAARFPGDSEVIRNAAAVQEVAKRPPRPNR
ncbi:MAG TPA: glycosyltransferase family 39 protein, partial [Gemmatimonadales bacterium]|nr:glycosyltransferase family 39 protein [Gemmatimonadales bacterium]